MKENVFEILKANYIPDMELTYDILAEITNRIVDEHPDVHYTLANGENGVSLGFDNYEVALSVMPFDYNTGTPFASLVFTVFEKDRMSSPYLKDIRNVNHNNHSRPIMVAQLGRHVKKIRLFDEAAERENCVSAMNWMTDILLNVNEKFDSNTKVVVEKLSERKNDYYDD